MNHLHLVRPAGQDGADPPARRRKRRHLIPPLTPEESGRLRAALRTLHKKFGSSWNCLAAVLDMSGKGLENIVAKRSRGSAAAALRVARLTGVSVEALLSGLVDAGKCPHCGQKVPALLAGGAP